MFSRVLPNLEAMKSVTALKSVWIAKYFVFVVNVFFENLVGE